ncbi:MAG TPA: DUF4956 domain-containing protein [Clostridiales bacterium]|jgi:uncharacterized membrane protein YhiD involved in acid resistance|nr:DUF4956 domain-containing protein [Clostridiales bacterium]
MKTINLLLEVIELIALASTISKQDIVSASWLRSQFSAFTPKDIALVLLFSLIASILIALVYKKTYRGVLYDPSFSITLILLCMVTSSVVMAIGSNVALSMGMVGALSIVRFRTAVKDSIDTAYMFWCITMGILIGTRFYLPAMVMLVGIAVVMLAISFLRLKGANCYLLVLHFEPGAQPEIESELQRSIPRYRLRSKTVTRSGAEATYEVRLRYNTDLVSHMLNVRGVYDATMVSLQNEAGI